jgi:hypothetical protein
VTFTRFYTILPWHIVNIFLCSTSSSSFFCTCLPSLRMSEEPEPVVFQELVRENTSCIKLQNAHLYSMHILIIHSHLEGLTQSRATMLSRIQTDY